ncbi:MAG: nickel pincer cofactor biosynthesis protein LarB [Pseudomonadota bacterium]
MNKKQIEQVLLKVKKGEFTIDEALTNLADLPFQDLDFCKFDKHRPLRNNFSETIFCQGKSQEQILKICQELVGKKANVLGTRVASEIGEAIQAAFNSQTRVKYDPVSKTFQLINHEIVSNQAKLAILCAGTADVPVAEEARITAQFYGIEANRYYDVGVAGLHRVLSVAKEISQVDCAIVIAGMEGALPSVVGGLIACPIIAVPTSVGYGTNLNGVSALLGMLNSCAEGITVVNIDNGFGAACAALRILHT